MSSRLTKLYLIILTLLSLGFAQPVGAANVLDPVCQSNPDATLCKENTSEDINNNSIFGPNGIITKVAQGLTLVVGVASVIVIIISGIQYAFSSGDPARLNRAKDTLIYALIGVVIAMSAQAIIVFVLRRIG